MSARLFPSFSSLDRQPERAPGVGEHVLPWSNGGGEQKRGEALQTVAKMKRRRRKKGKYSFFPTVRRNFPGFRQTLFV